VRVGALNQSQLGYRLIERHERLELLFGFRRLALLPLCQHDGLCVVVCGVPPEDRVPGMVTKQTILNAVAVLVGPSDTATTLRRSEYESAVNPR
jgi:hypothetical protein